MCLLGSRTGCSKRLKESKWGRASVNTNRVKVYASFVQPYGTVWRTGANSATVIKFTDEVTLEGKKVPAGEYGLFSIPGEKDWTIILSKQPKQCGVATFCPTKGSNSIPRTKL